jgi:hypothetical protein
MALQFLRVTGTVVLAVSVLLLQLKNDTAKVVSATISETCVNFIDSDRYFIFVLLFFFYSNFLKKGIATKK